MLDSPVGYSGSHVGVVALFCRKLGLACRDNLKLSQIFASYKTSENLILSMVCKDLMYRKVHQISLTQ